MPALSLDDSKRSVKQKIKDTKKSNEFQDEKFETKEVGTVRNHFNRYSDLRDTELMKNASSLGEHIMGNNLAFKEALVQLSDMSVRLVNFFANMDADPEHLQEQMTHNAWKQLQKVTSKRVFAQQEQSTFAKISSLSTNLTWIPACVNSSWSQFLSMSISATQCPTVLNNTRFTVRHKEFDFKHVPTALIYVKSVQEQRGKCSLDLCVTKTLVQAVSLPLQQ